MQVRQSVDGWLESSSSVEGHKCAPAFKKSAAIPGVAELGRRISLSDPLVDYFREQVADLVIADRVLESPEIVSLMNSERLSSSAVADSRRAPRTLVRSRRVPTP
ncbi:MAG: hypothetical protein RL077_3455 [Verrucomicrobiota bacterium]|jgi:hypothetical protein